MYLFKPEYITLSGHPTRLYGFEDDTTGVLIEDTKLIIRDKIYDDGGRGELVYVIAEIMGGVRKGQLLKFWYNPFYKAK